MDGKCDGSRTIVPPPSDDCPTPVGQSDQAVCGSLIVCRWPTISARIIWSDAEFWRGLPADGPQGGHSHRRDPVPALYQSGYLTLKAYDPVFDDKTGFGKMRQVCSLVSRS